MGFISKIADAASVVTDRVKEGVEDIKDDLEKKELEGKAKDLRIVASDTGSCPVCGSLVDRNGFHRD